MHKRTLFILPVIAGVLCLAFPVVLEQLGTPRLLPDGVDSLLGMVGMTVLCAALNILRRLSAPACRRKQKPHLRKKRLLQNGAVSPRQKRQRSRLKSPPASPAPRRRTRPKNKAGPNQHC